MRISRRDLLRSAALLPALRLAGQDSEAPPKFSTDVSVVNVLVTVRDPAGKIIANLTKDDFQLTEDGRPETIEYFAQQFDSPLTLGLLVDTSGSELRHIDAERRASYQFFDHVLREDRDKAFLIHFDWQIELVEDLTSSRTQLDKGLDTLQVDQSNAGGGGRGRQGRRGGRGGGTGTALYDAVFLASNELMAKQQGRKAIILFSDGEDRGSKEVLTSAIEAAQRADTLVYAIRFGDNAAISGFGPGSRGRRRGHPGGGGGAAGGRQVMQQLAEETGCAYFEAGSSNSLEKIYARIQDELRNQYNLGYTSDQHAPAYRTIHVSVKRRMLKVQARKGYYAR